MQSCGSGVVDLSRCCSAGFLDTTVGYLLGESDDVDLFKDPIMLKRLSELDKMEKEDKNHILHVLDGFIKSVKLKNIAAL